MKKLHVLVLCITTIFMSCNSLPELEVNETNLIGKWIYVAGTADNSILLFDDCERKNTIELKTDNISIHVYHDMLENGECEKESLDSKWSLSKKRIKFENDDDPYTVTRLTAENMDLEFVLTDEDGKDPITYVDTYKKVLN